MIKKVKYTMLIAIMCTGLLSGCTLFPLKGETEVSKTIQTDDTTPEPDMTTTPEPEVSYRPEDVIAPVKIPETEETIMYCVSAVNVRDAAGMNSSVIGELTAGEKVTMYSKAGGWVEIRYNGQKAYVYEEYLSESLY